MSYTPTVVKSTQQGTATFAASVTVTSTITAVDINKTQLTLMGFSTGTSGGSTYEPIRDLCRITLTNSTTVTGTRGGTASTPVISFRVVEFY